jgi:D-hydroxyproline dehydrogenase
MVPMAGRLRAAGTVELGGRDAPPSPHRWDRIEAGVRAIFPDLPPPTRRWMGLRPSLPDSLPVIGPAPRAPDAIFAFGHGHLGLTLAPRTAAMVADLVAGRRAGIELAPYSATRFWP